MEQRLKRWEVALMLGVLCTLIGGSWLQGEQDDLASRIIRLHVVANSDSAEDQELKLAVRDRVLAQAETLYPEGATLEEARQVLEDHLDVLAAAGQEVVEEEGYDYSVSAKLTRCWFPTRTYGEFALPAGDYTALRVVVGEGNGQNWWCVAFPPLCLGVTSETVEEAAQAGQFTQNQARLVTGESGGYVLKFKGMELIGQLREWLR